MAMPWARKFAESSTHQAVNPFYRALEAVGKAVTSSGRLAYSLTHPNQGYSTQHTSIYPIVSQYPSGSAVDAPPRPKEVPQEAPQEAPKKEPPSKGTVYKNPWVMGPVALLAVLGIAGAVKGDDIYRSLTSSKPAAERTTPNQNPQASQPEAPAAPQPTIRLSYWESPDGLAKVNFPGLSEADARPFINGAYQKAQTEGKIFDGVVFDGRMQRAKSSPDGKVRVELDCGPVTALECDDETLSKVAAQSEEAYRFIMAMLKPSNNPGIYVTVSADGKRANVTSHDETKYPNHVNLLRKSATSFYPWHVTDDFGQMTHETAGSVADALELVSEGFLFDFWGGYVRGRKFGVKPSFTKIGDYFQNRSVAGLGTEVDVALNADGFTDSQFTQLAQRLEGKNARWEQFKAEAKAVAGRNLPTLDLLDGEVKLYRELESGRGKQGYNFGSKDGKVVAHANSRSRTEKERWAEQRNAFERKILSRAKSYMV